MSFDPIASVSSTGFKSPAGVHLEPFSKKSAAEMAEEMRSGYLRMKTDDYASVGGGGGDDLIRSDLQELGVAARKLADHALMVVGGYLLILDRTNWRTNMLTSLLIPYIFLSLPSVLFSLLRGEFGKWVASIAVILRLFFPRHFPDWLEMPGALILLLVVSPGFFASTVRDSLIGVITCLAIGCYLLHEHIQASGGFRNSFTKSHGVSNSIGIILLLVYPIWHLFLHFL
ncbi:cold-regulated 413 plasma membrane protein 2-like isoform X2 [Musa acuminata AAA Group]|uniref:cold-regulated 413 plasma membrane protein 2-like isoform X2 n=1 Tax=Musa acuminata AAA Group TaxID=214697 RepID=UPI0031E2E606